MREEVAALLTEDMGEVRDDYSGRGMYGESTYAVTYDSNSDFEAALLNAAFDLGANGADDVEGLLADMRNLRKDSMGMGIVVY